MNNIKQKPERSPAYLKIYKQVREDIINGLYPYMTKLPSKRSMSDRLGVSTVTIEHAYALLCDEGYAEARERSGFVVIFKQSDGFAAAEPAQSRHIRAVGTEHSQFPFSALAKTMRRVITDEGEGLLSRSENTGIAELREAISRYLARSRGIIASKEQIVIGSGSEYLYSLIVELFGRNKTFAIESPSYKKIEQVYKACEVKIEMLPLGNEGIEGEALWQSDADILHISPYRSYPSGVTASASKRHEYIKWGERGERWLVEDDFESEFTLSRKHNETLFSLTESDNVIYMNSFSKTISPSLRVGYMVIPERLVPVFSQKLGFYSCTVPTYIQLVVAQLIENGDFERHINRVRRQKRREQTD